MARSPEELAHEVVRLAKQRMSMRAVGRALRVGRNRIRKISYAHPAERTGETPPTALPPPPVSRPSMLDDHEAFVGNLLVRFPDITAQRIYEELLARQDTAFAGGYTIVKEHVRWEGAQPIYNPRFVAFATYYDFRSRACRPFHPNDKPHLELSFRAFRISFFNARDFHDLDDLKAQLAHWMAGIDDERPQRRKQRRTPLELHAEEQPHLVARPRHRLARSRTSGLGPGNGSCESTLPWPDELNRFPPTEPRPRPTEPSRGPRSGNRSRPR